MPRLDPPQRLHALDALRAGALILGIVLHAAMSFVPAEQYWVVRDSRPSEALSGIFFTIHIFRMTTFFVIAGFFARMSFHRLGAPGFVADRLKRIALPLVVGWLVLMPLFFAVSFWAMGHSYGPGVYDTPMGNKPMLTPRMLPLQHLWFLYLLAVFYTLAVMGSWVMNRLDPGFRSGRLVHRIARRLINSPFAALALAGPATLALAAIPNWTMWAGVPAPDRGLFPNLTAMTAYGAAFTFGWAMHRQIDLLQVWKRWWWANLALALALTAVCLSLSGVEPLHAPVPHGLARLGHAAAYAFAGWTWTFALIGLSLRFLSGHSPVRRYLADASYWMYLIHLPLVVALQGAVAHMAWPAELKLLFILGVSVPVMLASYQLLVRSSFIGAVLNGRRRGPIGGPIGGKVEATVIPVMAPIQPAHGQPERHA